MNQELSRADIARLQELARRKQAAANSATNQEKIQAWLAHDAGENDRIMILGELIGLAGEAHPVPPSVCTCSSPWARSVERGLLGDLYAVETYCDDRPISACTNVRWQIDGGHYGVVIPEHDASAGGQMGSKAWDPVLIDLDTDLEKLKHRTFSVDREATKAAVDRINDVMGEWLPARIRGLPFWSLGMTDTVMQLMGMEDYMLAMYDNPEGLHSLMRFMCDDYLTLIDWLEQENLIPLNNADDYVGSGSVGYTQTLPEPGRADDQAWTLRDCWLLLESQETVGISPDLFAEFVLPYQRELAERCGRLYYGCCEPLHERWEHVKTLPNLARASVSPWADQAVMAERLGRDYVYSRKPNPTLVSTATFDEEAIRADLRNTLAIAGDLRLEIIMKDVHTLNGDSDRMRRWVQIARGEVARYGRG